MKEMADINLILAESIEETNNIFPGLHGTLIRLASWQELPSNIDWATARCDKYELLYIDHPNLKTRYIGSIPVYDTYWVLVTNNGSEYLEDLPPGTKFEVEFGLKNTLSQEEEDELQRLTRKIKYNQPIISDLERADELTRKKWKNNKA